MDLSTDNYKYHLKSFVQKQLERSAKNDPLPYSRVFREKQTKRMFEQLNAIKGSYAQTYD